MVLINATPTGRLLKEAGNSLYVRGLINHLGKFDGADDVFLTFDDGYIGGLENAEFIEGYGVVFIKVHKEPYKAKELIGKTWVCFLRKRLAELKNWEAEVYFELDDDKVFANITKEKIVEKN